MTPRQRFIETLTFGRPDRIPFFARASERVHPGRVADAGPPPRRRLARLEPAVRDGGYIPGCDHGVPADVSWPNFVDYARLLARITGWL
jgi:hypothetical protein